MTDFSTLLLKLTESESDRITTLKCLRETSISATINFSNWISKNREEFALLVKTLVIYTKESSQKSIVCDEIVEIIGKCNLDEPARSFLIKMVGSNQNHAPTCDSSSMFQYLLKRPNDFSNNFLIIIICNVLHYKTYLKHLPIL